MALVTCPFSTNEIFEKAASVKLGNVSLTQGNPTLQEKAESSRMNSALTRCGAGDGDVTEVLKCHRDVRSVTRKDHSLFDARTEAEIRSPGRTVPSNLTGFPSFASKSPHIS
jgi:hypothetical protein